eukprot:Pgem_evm1s2616
MSDYYGQKGIPWHGAAILYKQNGKFVVIYVDQICRNSGKEDEARVGLLFDSIMEVIENDKVLQEKTNITVLCDNAPYYAGKAIFRIMYYICKKRGFNLKRYFHNESCDGKTFLDDHFGVIIQLLIAYINRGFNILTPQQLAIAISLVSQSFVLSILIQFDGSIVTALTKFAKSVSQVKGIQRVRDITFEDDNAILNYFSNTNFQPLVRLSLEQDIKKLDEMFPDGFGNTVLICVQGSCGTTTIEEVYEEGSYVAKNIALMAESDKFEEEHYDDMLNLEHATSSLEYAKVYTGLYLDSLSLVNRDTSITEFQETYLSVETRNMVGQYFGNGWASFKKRVKYDWKFVSNHLKKMFDDGNITNSKLQPAEALENLVSLQNANKIDKSVPLPSVQQVKSYFSRLTSEYKKQNSKAIISAQNNDEESEEENVVESSEQGSSEEDEDEDEEQEKETLVTDTSILRPTGTLRSMANYQYPPTAGMWPVHHQPTSQQQNHFNLQQNHQQTPIFQQANQFQQANYNFQQPHNFQQANQFQQANNFQHAYQYYLRYQNHNRQ